LNNNLTEKQEEQLYEHIEERLQDMSHQDLLEVVREKLIDFYFDWGKAELIENNLIKEDK
jgi:tRNA A37 N6-isopentenylltransferase MiaA